MAPECAMPVATLPTSLLGPLVASAWSKPVTLRIDWTVMNVSHKFGFSSMNICIETGCTVTQGLRQRESHADHMYPQIIFYIYIHIFLERGKTTLQNEDPSHLTSIVSLFQIPLLLITSIRSKLLDCTLFAHTPF
jgi:hypothetical protein